MNRTVTTHDSCHTCIALTLVALFIDRRAHAQMTRCGRRTQTHQGFLSRGEFSPCRRRNVKTFKSIELARLPIQEVALVPCKIEQSEMY